MRKVLPRIISYDQTGFLKKRFIGENIRLLDSIINYTNLIKQIPGLLLFVDFEKPFDSVCREEFIEKTLCTILGYVDEIILYSVLAAGSKTTVGPRRSSH